MYEMTHKGAWFEWSALDRIEKRLVAGACAAAAFPGLVAGLWLGERSYRVGHRLGSGGGEPASNPITTFQTSDAYGVLVLLAIVGAVVSGLTWWRFSLRQDELFNRVQNYAIGHGSAWAFAGAALWWMLSLPGWVVEPQLGWIVTLSPLLALLFWGHGVRRWA